MEVPHPLNCLFEKGSPETFTLDNRQKEAFDKLIYHVCPPPLLALPRPALPYCLDGDASAYDVGCALF